MKYQLTEKEYKDLIPGKEHRDICEKYEQEIRNVKNAIKIIQTKLKLKSAGKGLNISPGEIGSLLVNIQETATDLIFSLVKKRGGKFPSPKIKPIEFILEHSIDWCGICQVNLGGIDSKEHTILNENGDEIELDTLTTESAVKLATFLEEYYRG